MSPKRRGFRSGEEARQARAAGHKTALAFALAIGMKSDYRNDTKAKKDVIDPSGDAHSLKSGDTHWQLFLYSRSRFEEDDGFQALNGVGALLIHCLDTLPSTYDAYQRNKLECKERLRTPMRDLKDKLQRKTLLRAFLMKSIFNGGEVNYLTVFHDGKYHVFLNTDVVKLVADKCEVVNSVRASADSPPEQKVLLRVDGVNLAELEMRTDRQNYARVRFNMKADRMTALLKTLEPVRHHSVLVTVYGKAISRFGRWP